jgi:hypothetical protein
MVSLVQNRASLIAKLMHHLLTIKLGPDGNISPPKHNSHLTSAFEDVILVPLASWLFLLLLLPILFLLTRRNHRRGAFNGKERSKHFLRWHDYVKAFFALAIIAMTCLEIARLVRLDYGIGLLPFTPACFAIAITINLARHRTPLKGLPLFLVVMVYFLILLVVESVKLNTQIRLQENYPRKGSQYPASDQVIDLAALVACLGVLIAFTLLDLFLG